MSEETEAPVFKDFKPSELIRIIGNRAKQKRFNRDEQEFFAALAAVLNQQQEEIRELKAVVSALWKEGEGRPSRIAGV